MERLPLVFACSGCSLAGRLAYGLAQELDRRGVAEMSCLAGVGAGKSHFLKPLQRREVWIIDGCPIECSLGVFEQVRRRADVHIRLHELGVKKNSGMPPGWDMDRLLDAAATQVSEQRSLKGSLATCEIKETSVTRSRPISPPLELPSRAGTLVASRPLGGPLAYCSASQT